VFGGGKRDPGSDHEGSAEQQQISQIVTGSNQSNQKRQQGCAKQRHRCDEPDLHWAQAERRRGYQLLALAVLSIAARRPLASFRASSLAQK
jgi:hypothetical protein